MFLLYRHTERKLERWMADDAALAAGIGYWLSVTSYWLSVIGY